MAYFKKISLLLLFSIIALSGCSSDDSGGNLSLVITDFQPSYNQVVVKWELVRPSAIIIQDLQIYRKDKNPDDTDTFLQPVLLANLPSNATTYTDLNVPYKSEVSYFVRIRYKKVNDDTNGIDYTLESDVRTFSRNLVLFNQVPLQVQQDILDANAFHILDKSGMGALKKYSASLKEITTSKTFTEGSLLNNRFHIYNNEVYVADTHGKIARISATDYHLNATYNTTISDNLNAFAVDGDRIYYQDENILNYYTISSGVSTVGHLVSQMDYAETLSTNRFLFMYAQQGSYGFNIKGYSTLNCNSPDCFADYTIYPTGPATVPVYRTDPYIFAWNPAKDKFITSYEGWVINLSTLQPELKLNAITGKHYFQFAYDTGGNIYATVQGEKTIHKFNSNYQLIDSISTKLYPIFPMVTTSGLQVIGSYEAIDYWGFWYGYEFNFNEKNVLLRFFSKH
ncbi:MAG: hypothetical protein M0D53_13875 [Flavobacterium sp. JAD_PAG50586_2]|nr:MAG: hypothetical protein M0D53_13875 [Flavobacterium sp. JAD_PAG50586_2]